MSKHRRLLVLTAVALYSITVLLADLVTPMGIEVWVLNLPLLMVPILVRNTRMVVVITLLCSAMVVVGWIISPPGNNPPSWDLLNRGMGLGAMLLIAIMARHSIQTATRLDDALGSLRREIAQHIRTSHAKAQSEERLRLAVEGAQMGTYDVNLRTGTVLCSAAQLRMLGLPAEADAEHAVDLWTSWIYVEDRARIQKARDDALRQRSLYNVEYRVQRADNGAIAWLAVFGCFHYDDSGEAVRFTGVSFDITPRKELEREIRQKELARELLEITNREQQHIGHELHDGVGQELTGLGLMAQSLTQRLPDTSAEKRAALRLVRGLNHVHEQLRALARGLLPVDIESKGLWAALDDLAARTSEQSGVAVTFECPEWVEMPDHATSMELFRITQEAVSNALRHGRPKSVRLSILSQPNGLRLRIKDDGVGIPDPSRRGNGLGIRIMQYRAESIHGELGIKLAEGGGTVVTVTLPGRNTNEQRQNGSAVSNEKDPYCR
jgi:two-component system sensor kinase FixL